MQERLITHPFQIERQLTGNWYKAVKAPELRKGPCPGYPRLRQGWTGSNPMRVTVSCLKNMSQKQVPDQTLRFGSRRDCWDRGGAQTGGLLLSTGLSEPASAAQQRVCARAGQCALADGAGGALQRTGNSGAQGDTAPPHKTQQPSYRVYCLEQRRAALGKD